MALKMLSQAWCTIQRPPFFMTISSDWNKMRMNITDVYIFCFGNWSKFSVFLLTGSSGLSIKRLESVHFGSLPREFCFCPACSQTATARALFNPGGNISKKSWTLINPRMNKKPGQALVNPLRLKQNTISF
jgi:hypothetical protein